MFLNIFTLVALMHSSGNLFQSFTTLWENVHFLVSNLEWHFTKARLCPLVLLSFFIMKNISLFNPSYPCIILKTSIWSPRIRLYVCDLLNAPPSIIIKSGAHFAYCIQSLEIQPRSVRPGTAARTTSLHDMPLGAIGWPTGEHSI